MSDNSMTEHQALGEALSMLRDLMVAITIEEDWARTERIMEANAGKPAKWMKAWREAAK